MSVVVPFPGLRAAGRVGARNRSAQTLGASHAVRGGSVISWVRPASCDCCGRPTLAGRSGVERATRACTAARPASPDRLASRLPASPEPRLDQIWVFSRTLVQAIIREHISRGACAERRRRGEGQTTSMRELIQIESASEHQCAQPSIERWQVLEPIFGRWSWMTVFNCCDHVAIEALSDEEQDTVQIKRAAYIPGRLARDKPRRAAARSARCRPRCSRVPSR